MIAALLCLALASEPPHEPAESHEEGAHEAAHEAHHAAVVGAKALVIGMPGEEAWESFVGPGLIGEVRIPGAPLEVEVAAAYLGELEHKGFAVPLDLLLKLTGRVGDTDLFVGLGPMVTLVHHGGGEVAAHPGGLGSAGLMWWVLPDVGVLLEVDGGAAFHGEEGVKPEVEGGLGLAFGF